MKRKIGKVWLAGALAGVAAAIPASALAATGTINVTTLVDADSANGACSLREAIIAANNGASYKDCSYPGGASDVNIELLPGPINLTSRLPNSSTRPKKVRGKGAMNTTINGAGKQGMLVTSSSISFLDLTFDNFSSSALDISAGASASIDHVLIHASGTSGVGGGGCLNNNGALGVYYSQLERCLAFEGAAIATGVGSNTIISNSTVLKSESEHGIIYNRGTMSFLISTLGANRTGVNAGIYNNGGNVTIDSSTLAYGMHYLVGAVANELYNSSGTMRVKNSIIFSDPSAAGPDCGGTIISDGNNAFRSGAGCNFASAGDRAVPDPQLQPGGTEETFANVPKAAGGLARVYVPAATSPIINQIAGSPSVADQRGVHRKSQVPFAPVPTGSDIGAVQRGIALLVVGNTFLSIGDTLIKNLLEKDGFTVTVKADTAVTTADANGWTVVVISESVTSANVNSKFRGSTSGVVVNESALFDDMNMTGAAADQYGVFADTTINVERGSIGRKAGWLGNHTIVFSGNSLAFGIPSSAQLPTFQAWRTGFPSQAMLFYYPKGMSMVGFVAPGVRVGTCFTNVATGSLAVKGERLLEESILLAAGPIF
jgi:CSLREA domain-containing protein